MKTPSRDRKSRLLEEVRGDQTGTDHGVGDGEAPAFISGSALGPRHLALRRPAVGTDGVALQVVRVHRPAAASAAARRGGAFSRRPVATRGVLAAALWWARATARRAERWEEKTEIFIGAASHGGN